MLDGRRVHDWGMAASHMALLANCNRNPKYRKRPFDVFDFVPPDLRREFRRSHRTGMTPGALRALKPLFAKGAADGKGS